MQKGEKSLRFALFTQLNRLEGIKPKAELKNNNLLKELKASVNVALARMSEISGKKLGRRKNFKKVNVNDYKKIALLLAHRYKKCLRNTSGVALTKNEMDEIFDNLVEVGLEGIVEGIVRYDSTKNTMLSTFIFNRAQYSVSKYYQKVVRENNRNINSLNVLVNDDETKEFQNMLPCEGTPIDEVVEHNEVKAALVHVMKGMPKEERKILDLCSEYKVAEVARRVNLPARRVRELLKSTQYKINVQLHSWR